MFTSKNKRFSPDKYQSRGRTMGNWRGSDPAASAVGDDVGFTKVSYKKSVRGNSSERKQRGGSRDSYQSRGRSPHNPRNSSRNNQHRRNGGGRGNKDAAVKYECAQVFEHKVTECKYPSEVGEDDIRAMASDINHRLNVNDMSTVMTTLLMRILTYVILIPVSAASGAKDAITSPADYIIKVLKPLIEESMEGKHSKSATGYSFFNALSWSAWKKVKGNFDDFPLKAYAECFEELVDCGCNPLIKNSKKNETALGSYLQAVDASYAPQSPEIEAILNDGITRKHLEKFICSLINKFSPTKVDQMSNLLKMVFLKTHGFAVTAANGGNPHLHNDFIMAFLTSMLGTHTFSKVQGYFTWVGINVHTCYDMFMHPIQDDEFKSLLEAQFDKTFGDKESAYKLFMQGLCDLAIVIESKTPDEKKENKAFDVVGALIGESTRVLGRKAGYEQYMLENLKHLLTGSGTEAVQNQIMTATVHMCKQIEGKPDLLSEYATPEIIRLVAEAATQNLFCSRVRFQLEVAFKSVSGKKMKHLQEVGQLVASPAPKADVKDAVPEVVAPKTDSVKSPKKRRRGRRGGKKHKSGSKSNTPPPANSYVLLSVEDDNAESVHSDVETPDVSETPAKAVEEKVDEIDVATILDMDQASRYAPNFAHVVNAAQYLNDGKLDGAKYVGNLMKDWNDDGTDSWAYGVKTDLEKKKMDAEILALSVVFALTGEVLNQSNFSPEALLYAKLVIADTFDDSTLNKALVKFLEVRDNNAKACGEDFMPNMWESPVNFGYFKRFLELCGLEY